MVALFRAKEDRSGCSLWVLALFFVALPAALYVLRAIVEGKPGAAVIFGCLALLPLGLLWWRYH